MGRFYKEGRLKRGGGGSRMGRGFMQRGEVQELGFTRVLCVEVFKGVGGFTRGGGRCKRAWGRWFEGSRRLGGKA